MRLHRTESDSGETVTLSVSLTLDSSPKGGAKFALPVIVLASPSGRGGSPLGLTERVTAAVKFCTMQVPCLNQRSEETNLHRTSGSGAKGKPHSRPPAPVALVHPSYSASSVTGGFQRGARPKKTRSVFRAPLWRPFGYFCADTKVPRPQAKPPAPLNPVEKCRTL